MKLLAKDLRLGNYVEYLIQDELDERKEWWELNPIDIADLCEIEENPNYRPIPLTDEWLIKLGFEWSIFHQAFHKYGFRYDLNSLYNGGWSLSTFKKEEIIVSKIDYVHQMQNLFHSLTGQELTINPK